MSHAIRTASAADVDAMAEGLSAIYFYWDPAERHRSLGTFNILAMIESARERGLPHVYLGYYVEGCRSPSTVPESGSAKPSTSSESQKPPNQVSNSSSLAM